MFCKREKEDVVRGFLCTPAGEEEDEEGEEEGEEEERSKSKKRHGGGRKTENEYAWRNVMT